jgi:UPF0716 family protein affecting phage T7 exclusion
VNLRRPRPGPRARRAVRRAAKAFAVVVLLFLVGSVLGVWIAAALVALVAVAGLIAGWAAVEARAFDHHRRSARVAVRAPGTSADHVAFARALSAVATAYLTECERQEHER